jgi:hypothetical protein
MLGFFDNTTVADAKSALSAKFGDAKDAAKTKLSDALKNPKIKLIDIVENQIKEIDAFLDDKKVELDTFKENHTKVENVIIKIKESLTDETGDTNRRVECSYYETYEAIGNNKITTEELTLSDTKEKRDLQIGFCVELFKENEDLLASLHKIRGSIGENITKLLITNNDIVRPKKVDIYFDNVLDTLNTYLTDNNNKPQEISVERFAELRNKLTNQSNTLRNYILPKCVSEPYKRLVRTVGGGSYKKTKRYKKINALNRGMRGGGVVEEEIKELEAFFGKHKGLEVLLQKRIALDVVLDNLYKNTLRLAFDKNGICEYYESYEDIGITKSSLTLSESNAQDKYNLQIGFRDSLIKEIENIKASISKEDIDGIRKRYKVYEVSLEKLFKDISIIDNPNNSFTGSVKSLFGVTSDSLKEQKIKLLKFLKQLEYLFETKYKYIKIENLKPIPNPHIQVGGGSYKKTNKKNILGKERCIYKKSGDRKEYIKYKGNFIAVREYKKLLKTR